ncbi:hypothetical protein ANN_05003 [Periplaneta americana]|uniref:Uncharacterized protein n=1 Tax=Periplaneta americana TaxID=6978 RepID=A0ABQ8T9X0_PERAM|nr:hypothetical protein ANN_05003 [Periplaneta americana]
MSPGSSTESYPSFAHIGLRENPGKNLNQVTCPDRESNPGHLALRPDSLTSVSMWTPQQKAFCVLSLAEHRSIIRQRLLDKVDDDDTFLTRVCFSDEATFHISGKVNRHNCRIWGRKIQVS